MSSMPPPGTPGPPGDVPPGGMPPPGGPPGQVPGYPPQPMGGKPDNYLVWAILSTLLCCLPLGIVSIVYSAKVDGLFTAGQYAQAREASDSAKKWALASAIVSLVGYALFGVLYIAIFAAAFSAGSG